MPDRLIEYLPAILQAPVEFFSCFLSYSTADQTFAERLYSDLQNHGVRCWFAPHDMRGGRRVYEQIDEAIRDYDRLLLILSESSMQSSWVRREIERARLKESGSGRRVLFPISLVPFSAISAWTQLDTDTGGDLAKDVRQYYVPDFSRWEIPAEYEIAFARLVRDLQPSE
jgi:hypothetical protein